MKRALLIAGGTVGGLGAVLSITPPQLGSQGAMGGLSVVASAAATVAAPVAQTTTAQTTTTPVATTPSATVTTPKATATKKKKVTKKKVAIAKTAAKVNATSNTSASSTPTSTATTPVATTSTPTATKSTAPAPAPKKVSGTFTGNSVNVNYGNVQVQITVVDGKITNAQALQAPTGGRSGQISQQAIPYLRQETLTAQSSSIQGVSGASYTSYGWYTSLQSALGKAGLPL